MSKKLPIEAFAFYAGLGPDRSYSDVAREFGVSKRTLIRRAKSEDWLARIEKIEAEARLKMDKKAVESIEEMGERHLKILRAIQGKALATLQRMELGSAMDAVRSLDLAVKSERLLRGDGSERDAERIEELHREEIRTLLKPVQSLGIEGDV
ncbi:MAG: hypothetical protein AAF368_10535 [Planctomycetota bacterium]